MLGNAFQFSDFGCGAFFTSQDSGHDAVDDEVRVTANGRGEVKVVFLCETIVTVRGSSVACLLQAAEKLNA